MTCHILILVCAIQAYKRSSRLSDLHPCIIFEHYIIGFFSLTERIPCIIDLHLNMLTICWNTKKKGFLLYLHYQKMGSSCSIFPYLTHILTEWKSGPWEYKTYFMKKLKMVHLSVVFSCRFVINSRIILASQWFKLNLFYHMAFLLTLSPCCGKLLFLVDLRRGSTTCCHRHHSSRWTRWPCSNIKLYVSHGQVRQRNPWLTVSILILHSLHILLISVKLIWMENISGSRLLVFLRVRQNLVVKKAPFFNFKNNMKILL